MTETSTGFPYHRNGAMAHEQGPTQPQPGIVVSGGMDQNPTVKINLDLSWSQIWKALVLVGGAAQLAMASGWLWMPAKESDLVKTRETLTQQITVIENQVKTSQLQLDSAKNQLNESLQNQQTMQLMMEKLTVSVDSLQEVMTQVRDQPPKTIVREVPRPRAAAPAPRRPQAPTPAAVQRN
jgi:hypothetical protein